MSDQALASEKATLETVTHVRHWTDKLFTFKTTRPANYRFNAGQYARLGLTIDGHMVWRAYSITSAPDDDFLEYYGIIVPDGIFTSKLQHLQPGDTIWTEKQCYGFMTPDRFTDGRDLWMLATGTGIGPFISILRDPAVWQRFENLVLVHCVRHDNELSYQDELASLQHNPPSADQSTARLQLIQSVTRDPVQAGAQQQLLSGRITTLLADGTLEKQAGLALTPEASRIMLCGNPDMIEDTRKLLHERGMRPCRRAAPGQFVTENYW